MSDAQRAAHRRLMDYYAKLRRIQTHISEGLHVETPCGTAKRALKGAIHSRRKR
jgi:hypothetical protein